MNVRILTDGDLPSFCDGQPLGEFGFQIAILPGFQSENLLGNTRVLSFGSRFCLMTGEITEADLQDAIWRICAFYLPDAGTLPICGALSTQAGETTLYLGRADLRERLFRTAGISPEDRTCGLGWSSAGLFSLNPGKTVTYAHPANVVLLIADETGVIPPISMLTNERAARYFEHGSHEAEPKGVHLCFGCRGSFRTARSCGSILAKRLQTNRPKCWMLNLGALGGPHGRPIDLHVSAALLKAALSGTLAKMSFQFDANFHLLVPVSCPGVPSAFLDQRTNWVHARDYDNAARTAAAALGA